MADETTKTITQIAPVAVFKKRGAKGKNIRKRVSPPPQNCDSDSAYTSSEDEAGKRVKRRKKSAVVTASSKNQSIGAAAQTESIPKYEADRSVSLNDSNDATKQSNWYDEDSNLLGKNKKSKTRSEDRGGNDRQSLELDGTYKGLANQTTFIQKNPNAPQRSVGPIKAPTNIRTVTFTDFAPDVCKDYKLTGFCGFGDNCKFLHAREDYKQGWQLDKDWENVSKGGKAQKGTIFANADRRGGSSKDKDEDENVAEEAMLEKIPFACILCKGSYRSPIVTRCGHYFCDPCAIERYNKKEPSCAACGARTDGIFNTAKTLNALLEKKRKRAARRRQEAIDAGEDVGEEEDET